MEEKKLLIALKKAQELAEGAFGRRLLFRPISYLQFQWHKRLIYPSSKQGQIKSTALFFGANMLIDLPAGSDLFLLGAKTHPSELRLAHFLIKQLKPGMHFVDVGAHFGYFTLLASHLIGPSGLVLSLEASPTVFSILQKNTNQKDQIIAIPKAAGARNGEITFFEYPLQFSEYNTTEASIYEGEAWHQDVQATQHQIEVCTLASILNKHQCTPNLIKIDVEGAEVKVFQGLQLENIDNKPIIIFEYIKSKPQKDLNTFLKEIEAIYSLNRITPAGQLERTSLQEDATFLDSENLVLLPL